MREFGKGGPWQVALPRAVFASLAIVCAVLLAFSSDARFRQSQMEAALKQNVLSLQRDIELWAGQHGGIYPASLEELPLHDKRNPFTGDSMPLISPGERHQPGGFSYLPLAAGPGSVDIAGYELIGYGSRRTHGARTLVASNVDPASLPLEYSIIHLASSVGHPGEDRAVLP